MLNKELFFTPRAEQDLEELITEKSKSKILKAVYKTLGFLETNLRHPSLQTHEYSSLEGPTRREGF